MKQSASNERSGSLWEIMMVGPILENALFVPRSRLGLVARPRLRERLNRGVDATLTLVSAHVLEAAAFSSAWRAF
jgi:hypothetical protein